MKRPNEWNSMEHFARNSNFYSIDFFHFFAKRRKSGRENEPSKEK